MGDKLINVQVVYEYCHFKENSSFKFHAIILKFVQKKLKDQDKYELQLKVMRFFQFDVAQNWNPRKDYKTCHYIHATILNGNWNNLPKNEQFKLELL